MTEVEVRAILEKVCICTQTEMMESTKTSSTSSQKSCINSLMRREGGGGDPGNHPRHAEVRGSRRISQFFFLQWVL